jgi:hypothetical protein
MKNPLIPLLSWGRAGALVFRDEHVAVGQHVEPARMIEVGCVARHGEAGRGGGFLLAVPAFGRRDLHGRNGFPLRLRQDWIRAAAGIDVLLARRAGARC